MRHHLLGILLTSTISSTALAGEPQQEMRAVPNNVPLQRGYGCVVGGATGATLSILGTIGTAVLPATALGCGIGAAAAPAASDAYEKYRIEGAIFINQVVRPATNRALDYVESWLDPSD
jgi:hypothetical protein